ncbi:hypothetical protein ACJ2A9_02675 [Anaerobacillus sp. MEB173]|uniref:hypothetical protein n=1 Tax=Anaerobacillus sp. MEB173 TaxID=3383345 RepID=UPI003F9065C1
MKSYLILAMCFLFLIQYFVQSQSLQIMLAIIALIAFSASITLAKTIPRTMSILMFIGGIIFTLLKGQGIMEMITGITANIPLLTLLVLVPLISIPFKMGGFFDSIIDYLQRYKNSPKRLFMGISTIIFFLGPILNMGAIRIIHEFIHNLRLNSTFLSKAYLVGFSTTILWSPYYAAVAIVLLYLQVSITDYMTYGFGLGVFFLIIGNVLFAIRTSKQTYVNEVASTQVAEHTYPKKLNLLALTIFSLMLMTILIESITNWSMLVIVSLVAILFPIIWCLVFNQWQNLKPYLIDYRDKSVPIMNNEIIMYISAGFFGMSLTGTSFGNGISEFMIMLSQISFLVFALFIVITMVCVTFLGIHQVVIVTVLATQMDPVMLGTSKEILAMLLMLAWLISSVTSPVNPVNLLVSNLVKKSSIEVGIRDNGLFLLVICIVGLTILTLISNFF